MVQSRYFAVVEMRSWACETKRMLVGRFERHRYSVVRTTPMNSCANRIAGSPSCEEGVTAVVLHRTLS